MKSCGSYQKFYEEHPGAAKHLSDMAERHLTAKPKEFFNAVNTLVGIFNGADLPACLKIIKGGWLNVRQNI